ncbi:MAG: TorF family putative porin [Gammaproteobacteria bacterium]
MKKANLLALSAAVAGVLVSSASYAGASANVGFTSDYYFRGIFQDTSSASAGLDYEHSSGVYVGTWLGNVADGLEIDYYLGYAGETSGFSYDISYGVFDYTDDSFDDKYSEVDLKLGYGPISIEYAVGEYDKPITEDYTFAAITGEYEGFYLTYGSHSRDKATDSYPDGSFTEIGYGTEVGGFDLGIAILNNDEDLDSKTASGTGETTMIFSLGKTFDL